MPEGLPTTVIGSFPKPNYVEIPDWFGRTGAGSDNATREMNQILKNQTKEQKDALESSITQGISEVVDVQLKCGIDVITDGEIRRENYIHYICRMIEGFDFDNLTHCSVRNGAYETALPTVRSKLKWIGDEDIIVKEWLKTRDIVTNKSDASHHIKYTFPGPLTICGTIYNDFYPTKAELADDLSCILNKHVVKPLVKAGCKYLQVDEPIFAREVDNALAFGLRCVEQCFADIGGEIEGLLRTEMHMCCGYPEYLDQEGYLKADKDSYVRLAPSIDELHCIDAISIEDAHSKNDLAELFPLFKKKQIIMGVVAIANSQIESKEEIQNRLKESLKYIDRERLIVAPDCGLGLLPRDVLEAKLANMCEAAKSV